MHDPNVDVLVYDSPDELQGIADLAEGGARDALAATLRTRPGVVAVKNLDAVGPIPAGTSLIADASGVLGAHVSVVGMFACTNDGYILATLPLAGTGDEVREAATVAAVIDSGSEANDETAATVPCLGGGPAAISPGLGEGSRSVHAGITGGADLDPVQHGWTGRDHGQGEHPRAGQVAGTGSTACARVRARSRKTRDSRAVAPGNRRLRAASCLDTCCRTRRCSPGTLGLHARRAPADTAGQRRIGYYSCLRCRVTSGAQAACESDQAVSALGQIDSS